MYYVYLLRSTIKLDQLYVGYTEDLKARLGLNGGQKIAAEPRTFQTAKEPENKSTRTMF